MATINEKKIEIEESLGSVQSILQNYRKELIELCVLAQEMRDSTSISPAMNNDPDDNVTEQCDNMRNDQASLLGYADFDTLIDTLDEGVYQRDDCSSDSTSSWAVTNTTLAFSSDHYTVITSSTLGTASMPSGSNDTFSGGTPIFVSIDAEDGTESSVIFQIYITFTDSGANTYTLTSPEITTTNTSTSYSYTFTPTTNSTASGSIGILVKNNLTGNFKIKNFIAREYYPDSYLRHSYRPSTDYQTDYSFTVPTTTSFGYKMFDTSGNELNGGIISNTSTSAYYYEKLYLVKDTTNDLVSNGDAIAANTPISVSKTSILKENLSSKTDSLTITSNFGESTVKGDANDIKPISGVDIYFNWSGDELKIGEGDINGDIINYGNYTYIDETNSSLDLTSQIITLILNDKTLPSDDITVELRYTYDDGDYTTVISQNYDSFDSTTNTFTTNLSNEPILDSLEIYLNDDQIGFINSEGQPYGTIVTSDSYFNSPTTLGIVLRDVNTTYQNNVNVKYIAKNEVSKTDVIGYVGTTELTYSTTLEDPVIVNSIEVYVGANKILDINDFTLAWTVDEPSISLTSTTNIYLNDVATYATATVCSCDRDGNFSLTITKGGGDYIFPYSITGDLKVVYNTCSSYTTWDTDYNISNIASVNNTGTPNIITLSSAANSAPSLLGKYIVKNHIDHTIYGHLEVTSEGLEINESWDFETDTVEECMDMNLTTFTAHMNWLLPYDVSGDDDLFKSCDSDEVSLASDSDLFVDIEKNPLNPSTNGTHTDYTNLYKDNYVNTMLSYDGNESTSYTLKWSVLQEYKYEFKRSPTITIDTVTSDLVITDRDSLSDLINGSYDLINGTITNLLDDVQTVMQGFSGSTVSGGAEYDVYSLTSGSYRYQIEETTTGVITHDFNDLCSDSSYMQLLDLMRLLRNSSTIIDTFYNELDHVDYRALFPVLTTVPYYGLYNEGGTYAKTLYDAITTFKTARTTIFTSYDTSIGDLTSGYCKQIYDANNYAISKNINFVKNVIDKYEQIVSFYNTIQDYIDEWESYDSI